MENKLTFKTNAAFNSIVYTEEADSWHFNFNDGIYFNIYSLWRLLRDDKIIIVSMDHGHPFGLSEPLDVIKNATDILEGRVLHEISVNQNTADIILVLTGSIKVEIYITSSGYESYDFFVNGERYIGMGSGKLHIEEKTK